MPSFQTLLLSVLMKKIGNKNTMLLGLGFQLFQLAWYGFGSETWYVWSWKWSYLLNKAVIIALDKKWHISVPNDCRMMWSAGTVAAMSSITFPTISALVSHITDHGQQGKRTSAHNYQHQSCGWIMLALHCCMLTS